MCRVLNVSWPRASGSASGAFLVLRAGHRADFTARSDLIYARNKTKRIIVCLCEYPREAYFAEKPLCIPETSSVCCNPDDSLSNKNLTLMHHAAPLSGIRHQVENFNCVSIYNTNKINLNRGVVNIHFAICQNALLLQIINISKCYFIIL